MSRRAWLVVPAVWLLAFACRLYPVLHGGGLRGLDGYDDGVYYAAADAVVAGRVPYRDFVLLHPPGLIYLLAPFAALGHLVGDADGWATARVAFMAIGATSAVVTYVVLRRFGPVAAIGGATLYAVWPPAINGETSTFLECVPNLLLLVALLLLGSQRVAARPWGQLLAGAALGVSMSIKIWGLVPLVVVVAWQLIVAGRRRALTVLAGSAAATVVVCAPTFVLAPARMWELVVADQFARSATNTAVLLRLETFTPVDRLLPHGSAPVRLAALVVVVAVGAGLAALAWRRPPARVFVVLLVAQSMVLLASPPYFTHYTAFTAPAAALTAGVGAQCLVDRLVQRSPQLRRPVLAVLCATLGLLALPAVRTPLYTPFDGGRVSRALAGRRCVTSDSPAALVLAGVLTRDLDHGCPTRIDVSGATYNTDALLGANGRPVPRLRNPLWQRDLMRYLQSGQAAIVARAADDGLDQQSRAALARMRLLYRHHGVRVYAP